MPLKKLERHYNMSKKKYTKCECCPFYAKNSETNKWECSRINGHYYSYSELKHCKGLCVFNCQSMKDEDKETAMSILNRWVNANED